MVRIFELQRAAALLATVLLSSLVLTGCASDTPRTALDWYPQSDAPPPHPALAASQSRAPDAAAGTDRGRLPAGPAPPQLVHPEHNPARAPRAAECDVHGRFAGRRQHVLHLAAPGPRDRRLRFDLFRR